MLVLRNPHAGVLDLEARAAGRVQHLQRHAALFGELDGIAQQIDQQLTHPRAVAYKHALRLRLDAHGKAQSLLRCLRLEDRLQRGDAVGHQERFVGQFETAGFDLREI